MRTVQMTLDEDLVTATRSAFARETLRAALGRIEEKVLEQKHKDGYRRHPVRRGEFSLREADRAWGDE